jgi:hypothetical protein
MSTQDQDYNGNISAEDIRTARHAGFDDSIAYLDDARRQRLTEAHSEQDHRRERNISGFYSTVLGDDA